MECPSYFGLLVQRLALRALRKGSKAIEGGNTGRRTIRSCRFRALAYEVLQETAVRSAPGRGRAEGRVYTRFATKGKVRGGCEEGSILDRRGVDRPFQAARG